MKKLMSTIAILAMMVGNSIAQDAPTKGEHPERHHKHRKGGMMADLPDLTEEQKSQIKDIKEAGKKSSEASRKNLRAIREQIFAEKESENPDLNKINGLIDKASLIKADIEKNRTAAEMKMRSILTPEQQKVLDAKQKERREMRKKKMAEKKEMRHSK